MKKIILSSLLLISYSLSAQKEFSCSNLKRSHNNLKSAGLTVAQIAETEKYDVNFIFLDIAMNNLSTNVNGMAGFAATTKVALDTALFELHANFNISEIRLNGLATVYVRNNNVLKVPINLSSNQSFTIEVDYGGTPPTAGSNPFGGSGMSNDSSPSWGNQVTWSLSEPFSAYEWFPCKQSLKDKADSSSVKITVPNSCKAGSNGILENVVDMGNGTSRYEWKNRHAIEYYLISVAIAQYVEYNIYANPVGAPNPILIQNFIYNNPQTLPYFQDDIDETVDFIELFSDLFGLYPFADEKYGHCMAPLSGGMEHQTMTTQGFFERTLTAHELAHQWWGDHVTCAAWSDIYVNEGLASYAEYIMLENLYPGDQLQDMSDRHNNIMSQPGGSVWVLDSLNENAIFSSRLVYDKGAALTHTLRFAVNNDTQFYQALRNFQNEFADSVAYGVDFLQALEDESGMNLNNYFSEWYYGEGYPTYAASWDTLGNDLLLKISHITSKPSVTPLFTNDLEVQFGRSGMPDTIVRVSIASNNEEIMIPNLGNATILKKIDPNNWIINKVSSIQYDNSLLDLTEESQTADFEMYPNPLTGNELFIKANKENNYQVKIYSLKGEILYDAVFQSETKLQFDFSSGSYILELISEDGSIGARKLLKL